MHSRLPRRLPTATVFAFISFHAAAGRGLEVHQEDAALRITSGGRAVATYVFDDPDVQRPFFENVRAPDGMLVTRRRPLGEGDPRDHELLHPGLFLAFGDINGHDFWRGKARVLHDGWVERPAARSGEARFAVRNRYLGTGGEVVCTEVARYALLGRPEGFLLLWDSVFEPAAGPIRFGDQEEMGLGVRVHSPLRVRGGSGRILDSEGRENEQGVWGKRAKWCDYAGPAGGRRVGVTLMPHPENFRPSRFHARDYGLLVANPFGRHAFTGKEKSRVIVEEGERLRLRFSVYIHTTPAGESIDLESAWNDYLESAKAEETAMRRNANKGGTKDKPSGSLRPDLMEQPGVVEARFLFERAPFRSCHASTIAETDDYLVCAYFAGTDEGHPDVEIRLSRKDKEAPEWAPPAKVADGIQEDGSRHPCWNPVLYQPREGPLLLFYKVGPSPSAWWGMLRTSRDQGVTWSEARRLPEGILGPVRAKPIELPDGTLLCGSSTEHAGWRVHMERTPDLGKTWTRTEPLNDGKEFRAIQPTILRHGKDRFQILCRSDDRLREAWSEDGGKTWTRLTPSVLPNPSAGIDAVTLPDGRHLLVYNHSTRSSGGRSRLNVAVSDDGKEWKAALLLEDGVTVGGRRAYGAYPAAILASDGHVHITYTWKRERINRVVVDPAELVLKEMPGGEWPE